MEAGVRHEFGYLTEGILSRAGHEQAMAAVDDGLGDAGDLTGGLALAEDHFGEPLSLDPLVVGANLVVALQTIVSRNIDPLDATVVTVGFFKSGSAYNVIPEEAHLAGTIRTFDDGVRALVAKRMREIAAGVAATFGAEITVEIRDIFSVLRNSEAQTRAAAEIATELFGSAKVDTAPEPKMGSEDFADMLHAVPGAYAWLGGKAGASLHNAAYDFDDAIIPLGAAYLARLVERRSAASVA